MSNKLDDAIASGDEQAIEDALNEVEVSDDLLFGDDDDESSSEVVEQEVVIEEAIVDKNDVAEPEVEKPTEEAVPESSPADTKAIQGIIEKDGKFFVEVSKDNAELGSKNGKHQLPYDLLAGTREENLALKKQLEDQARSNAELQSNLTESKRVAELYTKQLGEAGLDPKLLPEQMLQDPELMAQVKEDYPQIGELVEALASQLQANKATAQPVAEPAQQNSSSSDNPIQMALNETNHLKDWMNSDVDRWAMAKLIDGQLADNPSFANKSITERFLEVEKRVMNAFGDEVKQVTEELPAPKAPAIQPEKAPIPNTPTDIGHQTSDVSANAQLFDKDAETMTHQMESMSEAAIEAMLEEASDFL